MPRSWVCWWLLLGWALLLGEPGSGTEEGSPPAAEQEPGEVEEGPSDPAEVSFGFPEETSEELDSAQRRLLHLSWILSRMKEHAMAYISEHRSGALYKEYVGATMKIEKAVGVMTALDLFLEKTNCTTEEGLSAYPRYDSMDYVHEEPKNCVLPPESEQEKRKCSFVMFTHPFYGGSVVQNCCRKLIILHEGDQPPEDSEEAASTDG